MNIEFLKDSEELGKFVESCRFIDEVNFDNEGYDDRTFSDRIYQTSDGKTYSVECLLKKGIKTKTEFRSHDYIISFHEVSPVEVTHTTWERVD